MTKVVVTRQIPGNSIVQLQQIGYEVTVGSQDRSMTREELLKAVIGADAVLTQLQDKVDEQFLATAGPQLKIVANYAVGFDNFDLKAIQAHNVIATNTPDVLTEAVAEHTLALMLSIARRIVEADIIAHKQNQEFGPEVLLGTELKGKILGILGTGRIGSRVAEMARAIGMEIYYYDIKQNPDLETKLQAKFIPDPKELLKQADFVSIHVPLLDSTFHLINQDTLSLMKPTAYLINTSRGAVVDEQALTEALKNRQIRGAAIDVCEHEPKMCPGLESLMNIIVTPHIASATWEARTAMSDLAVENIIQVLSGYPPVTEVKG